MKFAKKMLEKYGKSYIYLIISAVAVVGVWALIFFQLFAGSPVLSKYENGEIVFKYPRWTTGDGFAVKSENPIRGAGIEVAKKENLNLPLTFWLEQTKASLIKDRKLIKEEHSADFALYVTEFSNNRGEFTMTTKVVAAGNNLYILSGYSLKKKIKSNQRVIDEFLSSIQIKKQPLFAKSDASGSVLKTLDGKLQGFTDKGEAIVLIYSKDIKIYDKKGEVKKDLLSRKYPNFTGKKFIAQGGFAEKSKLEFNVLNLLIYDETK